MIEASIKNGHIHCYIEGRHIDDVANKLAEFGRIAEPHLQDQDMRCIALKIEYVGKEGVENLGEMIISTYYRMKEENKSRGKTRREMMAGGFDSHVHLRLDCSNELWDCIQAHVKDKKHLSRIKPGNYHNHVRFCGMAYEREIGIRMPEYEAMRRKKKGHG